MKSFLLTPRLCAGIAILCLFTILRVPAHAVDKPDPSGAVPPAEATFSAGKETKILDPLTGGNGYYVVYVPRDYSPDRECPIIFCYHGIDQNPKSWPFKEVTGGNGFIVVGMEYLDEKGANDAVKDVANLKRIGAYVAGKLKVNSKLMFIGGFSRGGFETLAYSDLTIDTWAGIVILGAGGSPRSTAQRLAGKPVFVGVGQTDPNHQVADQAVKSYGEKGAEVTFEEFAGIGHAVNTKSEKLKLWLFEHGPQKEVKLALDRAKLAERSGKLGEAFSIYSSIGKMSGAGDLGAGAIQSARLISEAAEKKLLEAEAAIAKKDYTSAVKLLSAVTDGYAGSALADRAKDRMKQMSTDPAIQGQIEQARIDAKADVLEAQAQAAESARDFAKALPLYEAYVAQFAKATRFAQVKVHLDSLKANKTITLSVKTQAADRDCKGWLSTADNYIKNGLPDKAKPFLQKILDQYGDTTWAEQARKRMSELN